MVFIVERSLVPWFRRLYSRNDIQQQLSLSTSDLDVRRCMCCQRSPRHHRESRALNAPSADLPFPSFCLRTSDFLDEKLTFSRRRLLPISTTTTTRSFTQSHNTTAAMGRIKKKGMLTSLPCDYIYPNNHSQAPPATPKTTLPAPRPSANSNFPSQISDDCVSSRVSTHVSRATGSA